MFNKFRFFNKFPSYIIFFVTSHCNARCTHCFYWEEIGSSSERKELTLNEINMISRSLDDINFLTITGGEPSLRDDLPEIFKIFYKNNNIRLSSLHTNGILPNKINEFCHEIINFCPELMLNVSLSIDGLFLEHDRFRGNKDNFNNVLKTIELLTFLKRKFSNLTIVINTVYNYFNAKEVVKVIDFVHDNLKVDRHYLTLIRGNVKDKLAKNVSIDDYEKVCSYIRDKKIKQKVTPFQFFSLFLQNLEQLAPRILVKNIRNKKMSFPCRAGEKLIVIKDDGELMPCETLNKSFGNLRDNDYNVKKMLYSSVGCEIINYIRRNKCYCDWECAVMSSIIFNPIAYPSLFKEYIKNYFKIRLM